MDNDDNDTDNGQILIRKAKRNIRSGACDRIDFVVCCVNTGEKWEDLYIMH